MLCFAPNIKNLRKNTSVIADKKVSAFLIHFAERAGGKFELKF